jgi:REP element-mobilizing transposase RayT
LQLVWQRNPVYFITTCIAGRRTLLANARSHAILRGEWQGLKDRHGWAVGRYVVMPDHVHFFIAPNFNDVKTLGAAVGRWKEWTAKRLVTETGADLPIWQPEFFDHVLRSPESRSEKWNYVRNNPVRQQLVSHADEWPYAGSIDFE